MLSVNQGGGAIFRTERCDSMSETGLGGKDRKSTGEKVRGGDALSHGTTNSQECLFLDRGLGGGWGGGGRGQGRLTLENRNNSAVGESAGGGQEGGSANVPPPPKKHHGS